MGDPAGVGPEIIVKAWQAMREDGPAFLVVGDMDLLASSSNGGGVALRRIASPDEATAVFRDALPVLDLPLAGACGFGKGVAGPCARGHPLDRDPARAWPCRAPYPGWSPPPSPRPRCMKPASRFPGHTEYLGDLTRRADGPAARGPVMMLIAAGLRTALVTIHEPLAAVPACSARSASSLSAPSRPRPCGGTSASPSPGSRSLRSILTPGRAAPWAAKNRDHHAGVPGTSPTRRRLLRPQAVRQPVPRRRAQQLRRRPLHVPRPGPDPGEDARLLGRGERHPRLPIVRTSPDHGVGS